MSITEQRMWNRGGYRERFAMQKGAKRKVYINGHLCYRYCYAFTVPYQDANGATWDTVLERWIN